MKQIIVRAIVTVICIGLCAASAIAGPPDGVIIAQAEKGRQVQTERAPGRDLFDIIRDDHRKIREIFNQLSGPPGEASPSPREILQHLHAELVPHMIAEENTLYAELAKNRNTRQIAGKTMKEHQDLKRVLGELENLKDDQINSSPRIAEMRQLIINHARNEETVLFRRARNNLDQDQIANLAERFKEEKIRAQRR